MEINSNFTENAKNDFHLVVKAREGSQKAYADLMHRYKDSIYFMVLKMVNNKEDAMDLTVETFAKAFEKLDKYQPDYAFSTWLFRVATNNCIDFIRKKKLNTLSIHGMMDEDGDEMPLQIKADTLNPEESSIKKQQTEELKLLIQSLPQRYRNLITLRYFDELSYEEIAQQLDLPLGTVKAQLFRARYLLGNIINRLAEMTSEALFSYFPDLTLTQKQQFERLPELYDLWNNQINVISRKDIDQLFERHVLHSLGIAKVMPFLPGEKVLDVGTGGGFPGIPLAIMFPHTEFFLVDSIGKKIKVVQEVAKALGLKNVRAAHVRAEQVDEKFDFVVSRAVTRLKDFHPWVKNKYNKQSKNALPNGLLYLKGGDLTEEIAESNLKVQQFYLKDFFKEEFFDTKQVIYVKG